MTDATAAAVTTNPVVVEGKEVPSTTISDQDYVLAGGKGDRDSMPTADGYTEKQGHKCCGGCCDMRRATIIVNLVNIFMLVLVLWALAGLIASQAKGGDSSNYDNNGDNNGDDAYVEDAEEYIAEDDVFSNMGLVIAILVIRVAANAAGIYGAYIYNIHLVALSLAAYGLEMIISMFSFSLTGLFLAALFAYPHVYFIQEVRAGIMSRENYPNEEYSCCCV